MEAHQNLQYAMMNDLKFQTVNLIHQMAMSINAANSEIVLTRLQNDHLRTLDSDLENKSVTVFNTCEAVINRFNSVLAQAKIIEAENLSLPEKKRTLQKRLNDAKKLAETTLQEKIEEVKSGDTSEEAKQLIRTRNQLEKTLADVTKTEQDELQKTRKAILHKEKLIRETQELKKQRLEMRAEAKKKGLTSGAETKTVPLPPPDSSDFPQYLKYMLQQNILNNFNSKNLTPAQKTLIRRRTALYIHPDKCLQKDFVDKQSYPEDIVQSFPELNQFLSYFQNNQDKLTREICSAISQEFLQNAK